MMEPIGLDKGILRALSQGRGLLPMPEGVTNIESLNVWLGLLPVKFRDATPIEMDEIKFTAIGIGGAITREQLADGSEEENARLKRYLQQQTCQSIALIILGMSMTARNDLIWRVRPEDQWLEDPITDNLLYKTYCRIGEAKDA